MTPIATLIAVGREFPRVAGLGTFLGTKHVAADLKSGRPGYQLAMYLPWRQPMLSPLRANDNLIASDDDPCCCGHPALSVLRENDNGSPARQGGRDDLS